MERPRPSGTRTRLRPSPSPQAPVRGQRGSQDLQQEPCGGRHLGDAPLHVRESVAPRVRQGRCLFGDLGQWKKLVKGAARSSRFLNANQNVRRSIRLWNTEFSWDTKPPDDKGVPMKLHARGPPRPSTGHGRSVRLSSGCSSATTRSATSTSRPLPLQEQHHADGLEPQALPDGFRFPFVAYASHGRIKVWGRTPDSDAHTIRIERRTSSGGWHVVKSAARTGPASSRRTGLREIRRASTARGSRTGTTHPSGSGSCGRTTSS